MPIPNSQRIIQLREQRAWNQDELAARAGLSARTIWNAENHVNVQAATLHEIARALDIPPAELQVAASVPPMNEDGTPGLEDKAVPINPPVARIEIVIHRDFDSFTAAEQEHLLQAIKQMLSLFRDIHVVSKRPGSVILTLELGADDAERLYQAAEAGQLRALGVTRATRIAPTVGQAPFAAPAELWVPASPIGAAFSKPTKLALLIVDDEPAPLDVLVQLLRPHYHILTAESADAAEQVFRRQPVDLVLTDQSMPARTGIQLLEWVRSHSPHTVPLLMTGHGDEEVAVSAINRGHVYHYLAKPFRADETLHVLRNAAEKFMLERERDQMLAELQRSNRELEARVAERTRELEKAYSELSLQAREMERLALTDPLTRLFNRKAADALAMAEVKRHARYHSSLALGIIEIDNFKAINARYLLPGGDAVLVGLAKLLTVAMRGTDSVGRLAGDEFLVIARETNEEGARILAERIRQKVEQTPIDYNGVKVTLTVSIGFAVVEGGTNASYPQMCEAASAALLEAKRAGRNRCVIHRLQG